MLCFVGKFILFDNSVDSYISGQYHRDGKQDNGTDATNNGVFEMSQNDERECPEERKYQQDRTEDDEYA